MMISKVIGIKVYTKVSTDLGTPGRGAVGGGKSLNITLVLSVSVL